MAIMVDLSLFPRRSIYDLVLPHAMAQGGTWAGAIRPFLSGGPNGPELTGSASGGNAPRSEGDQTDWIAATDFGQLGEIVGGALQHQRRFWCPPCSGAIR